MTRARTARARSRSRTALRAVAACAWLACASGPIASPLASFWAPPPPAASATPEPALVYDPPAELPPPEGLHATSGQYREIALGWEPVLLPGVAGYVVESATEVSGPYRARVALRDRGVLAWVDRGDPSEALGDGATRFYRLRAIAHDGRVSSLVSPIVTATSAPLPAPPTGLRAWSRQPRSIPLTWDPSEDPIVTGYVVERSPNPGGPFEVVAQLEGRESTHLLDTGLGDLRVLHYRVSSRNSGGERGAPSNVLRAVTKPAPLPPIALRVESRRLGAVSIAWEPNVETDLLGYRLRRAQKDEPAQTITWVGGDKTRAEDIRVGAEQSYDYTLVAVDLDGLESRPSLPIRVTGIGYEWRAAASAREVRLFWNPRPSEGFVRARVTREGELWSHRSFVTESSELHDTEVAPGRTYRYRISLERSDGLVAPESPPIVVEVPSSGAGFVEIQDPASRLPQPENTPR